MGNKFLITKLGAIYQFKSYKNIEGYYELEDVIYYWRNSRKIFYKTSLVKKKLTAQILELDMKINEVPNVIKTDPNIYQRLYSRVAKKLGVYNEKN